MQAPRKQAWARGDEDLSGQMMAVVLFCAFCLKREAKLHVYRLMNNALLAIG